MSNPLPILDPCRDCGACCTHMGRPPFEYLTEQPELAWVNLPDDLRREFINHVANLDDAESDFGSPCYWLDPTTKRCRHHEHRPRTCRDFEAGGESCRDHRMRCGVE
ncbi:MAG: YkgJ family cysteine cluster protein [Planctomycetales bacterium]